MNYCRTYSPSVFTLLMIFLLTPGVQAMPPHPDLLKEYRDAGTLSRLAPGSRAVKPEGYDSPQRSFPTTGVHKVLVIKTSYSDTSFDSVSIDAFYSNLFNGATDDELSWKKYYKDVSGGNLVLEFDVVDAGNASKNLDYYGENDSNKNDMYPGTLVGEAVDAVNASVDFSQYDNDGDGYVDTVIIIHAERGEESGTTLANRIWSHSWTLDGAEAYRQSASSKPDGGGARNYDGVYINGYTIQPEYVKSAGDTTIGVFCHEFGHVLGLMDLYDTSYATSGVGDWSLMSGGSWNGPENKGSVPAPLLAWERQYLGWVSADNVKAFAVKAVKPCLPASTVIPGIILMISSVMVFFIGRRKGLRFVMMPSLAAMVIFSSLMFYSGCGDDGDDPTPKRITLEDIDTSFAAAKVPLNDPDGKQYYLIENKVQKSGTWSEYLPGSGLLISHIDEHVIDLTMSSNAINSINIHGVNIIEADGGWDLWKGPSEAGDDTDTLYSPGVTSITPNTYPASKYNYWVDETHFYAMSNSSGVYITGVSEAGSTMTFDYVKK